MAEGVETDMVSKFTTMIKDYKGKAEQLVNEINVAYGTNIKNAVKNYQDIQATYVEGYNGITGGARNANNQLLESFDKNVAELKKRITESHNDTKTKAFEALDGSSKDFRGQCEECIKKLPSLPEGIYKDVVKFLEDSKNSLNGTMDKQYEQVMKALDKNAQEMRKQLTMGELKSPKVPALDFNPSMLTEAKSQMTGLFEKASKKFEEVKPQLQNAADAAKAKYEEVKPQIQNAANAAKDKVTTAAQSKKKSK